MCLAIPMKITSIEGASGTAEVRGIARKIDLSLVQPIDIGECVLVHTGFALQKIDEEEFHRTLEVLTELAEAMEEEDLSREDLNEKRPMFLPTDSV